MVYLEKHAKTKLDSVGIPLLAFSVSFCMLKLNANLESGFSQETLTKVSQETHTRSL